MLVSRLRLTAAVLGAVTCKDLAAAFRRVNAATPFQVDRAQKWLQGRAHPRERQVYEDWARLLDLGHPGDWIADCDTESFLDAICARHSSDREALQRRAERSSDLRKHHDRGHMLAGAYACYSHAQSPYHRGSIVRGALVIEAAGRRTEKLVATYSQAIAIGRVHARGPVLLFGRAMCLNLRVPAGQESIPSVFCSLFLPAPPRACWPA